MSFDRESTNCALLSRCRLDDVIRLNTTPRVLQRLAEGKGVTILDYPLEVIGAIVPLAFGTVIVGVVGFVVGSAISVRLLLRLVNKADKLDRLWKQGVLIVADEAHVEEREYRDSDGDMQRDFFAVYTFELPQGELVRGERKINRSQRDRFTMLMLYRNPKDYLIL
jgi:hypothetical protein